MNPHEENGLRYKTIFFWGIFFVMLFGAVFVRTTHYEEWMIIKSDQIRDAMVSLKVLENGFGELPLFGPRAGGTHLRLGPIFYYFQTASALLFHSASPGVLALPTLLFSLLSIPLFFLMARRLFSRNLSLILTIVFSYGFLAIEHARFSWNPNSTTFFTLLFLYSFLRILADDTPKKLWWYAALGLSYGVVSQLHFTVLLALPLFIAFFAIFRPKRVWRVLSWKGVAIFLGVILLLYTPVFVSEVLSGGKNASETFAAVAEKGSEKTLIGNVRRVLKNFGEYFFRIGFGYFGGPRPFQYAGIALLGSGLFLSLFLFRKEKDESRRDVFLAIPILLATFFLLFLPIATTVDKPRFFLPLLFVPTIFFGMITCLTFSGKIRFFPKLLAALFLGASLGSNMFFTYQWLSEIRHSTHRYVSAKKDTVVLKMKKDDMWWSWEQIHAAVEYMIRDCPNENILVQYKGQAADFMHTTLYAFRLAGDDRIRRSTTYEGPSFCRYALTKSKPGENPDDDQWDIGDLRILALEKRGGSFDTSIYGKGESEEEPSKNKFEYWKDVTR